MLSLRSSTGGAASSVVLPPGGNGTFGVSLCEPRGGGIGRGGGLLLRWPPGGCSDDVDCGRSGGATIGLSWGRSGNGPGGLSGGGPLGLSGRGLLIPLADLQCGSTLASEGFSGGAGGGAFGRSGKGGFSLGDLSRASSLLIEECTPPSVDPVALSGVSITPGGIGAGFLTPCLIVLGLRAALVLQGTGLTD